MWDREEGRQGARKGPAGEKENKQQGVSEGEEGSEDVWILWQVPELWGCCRGEGARCRGEGGRWGTGCYRGRTHGVKPGR